ncbi:MAG: hypothetical protein HY220_02265 [Candidatus Sungbacteria bacterium]|uniref:Uncharacterized protein n=1 Tax=Candidatus Sungiibacteriota bacterium TaxID=2750080 RepID=A0A9D6QYM0_9BACT|nr:hypothetical protein [Candidatus Sungbacteria bacterium]
MASRKIIIIFFSLLGLALVASPILVMSQSSGIVPCGNGGGLSGWIPCTFCDFWGLLKNLIDFIAVKLALPLAVIMFIYAGFRYAFSAGKESNISAAREILTQTAIGLLIVFGVYFITDTLIKIIAGGAPKAIENLGPWRNPFEPGKSICTPPVSVPISKEPPVPYPRSNDQSIPLPQGTLSRADAVARLQAGGVDTGFISAECSPGVGRGCTSLSGVLPSTIDGAVALQKACDAATSGERCQLLITGGTETGHSDNGVTHASGQKLDFANSPTLYRYLQRLPDMGNGVRQGPDGTLYRFETNPFHWDVAFPKK